MTFPDLSNIDLTFYKYLETAVASGRNRYSSKKCLFSKVTNRNGALWGRRKKHGEKLLIRGREKIVPVSVLYC